LFFQELEDLHKRIRELEAERDGLDSQVRGDMFQHVSWGTKSSPPAPCTRLSLVFHAEFDQRA
jgi:hypothetical protein